MSDKYMKVERIDHGTVIDHILPSRAFDVLRVLGLSNDKTMSILVNSHSKKGGTKDILKIEDVELSAEEANLVALVSPAGDDQYHRRRQSGEEIQCRGAKGRQGHPDLFEPELHLEPERTHHHRIQTGSRRGAPLRLHLLRPGYHRPGKTYQRLTRNWIGSEGSVGNSSHAVNTKSR